MGLVSIAGIFGSSKENEYLLDGYLAAPHKKIVHYGGIEYELQYFQMEHSKEYLLRSSSGVTRLFKNGVLKLSWREENGRRVGNFTSYDKGRVLFTENWDNLLGGNQLIRIVNKKIGEVMEILDESSLVVIYRGGFDSNYERHGQGVEFDRKTGIESFEGVWEHGRLIRVLKEFDGKEMTEFVESNDNLDVATRVPIYIGGYSYNEESGTYNRNGVGYLIDISTRIANRECIWEDGVEVRGIDLFDGWYRKGRQATYSSSKVYSQTPVRNDPVVMRQMPISRPRTLSKSLPSSRPKSLSKPIAVPKSMNTPKSQAGRNESRESKELRELRELRELLDTKDISEIRDMKEGKDLKEQREQREQREAREIRDSRDSKEVRESKESKEAKESKEQREVKESKEPEIRELSKTIQNSNDWHSVSSYVTDLVIASDCCNDVNVLDFSRLRWLQSLQIGSDSFKNANGFYIDGLKQLKSIRTGLNSFTKIKNGNDSSRSFRITNCLSLKSIDIGRYSFGDYAGSFELKNLPELESIKIGDIGSMSFNFYSASLVLRGIFS